MDEDAGVITQLVKATLEWIGRRPIWKFVGTEAVITGANLKKPAYFQGGRFPLLSACRNVEGAAERAY
jgi:hypothetical protein